MNKRRRQRIDDALATDDIDAAAEDLAAWRALNDRPEQKELRSQVAFETIRPRLPLAERRWPGSMRGAWLPAAAAIGAVGAVLLLLQPVGDEQPWRAKGESPCCGSARLRVAAADGSSLRETQVEAGTTVSLSGSLSLPGWVSLFDVALADQRVTLVRGPERRLAGDQELADLTMKMPGKHILALIVAPNDEELPRSQIVELLRALGEDRTPMLRGEPATLDLIEIEVR